MYIIVYDTLVEIFENISKKEGRVCVCDISEI